MQMQIEIELDRSIVKRSWRVYDIDVSVSECVWLLTRAFMHDVHVGNDGGSLPQGTLDSLTTMGTETAWHLSCEIWRVLHASGVWLCISYANETSRKPYLEYAVLPRTHRLPAVKFFEYREDWLAFQAAQRDSDEVSTTIEAGFVGERWHIESSQLPKPMHLRSDNGSISGDVHYIYLMSKHAV